MRRLLRFITNKNVIIGFLIFLQLLLFFTVVTLFVFLDPNIGFITLIVLLALSYLTSIYILASTKVKHSAYKLSWVATIIIFPHFGGLFYLIYNTRNYSKIQRERYSNTMNRIKEETKDLNIEADNLVTNYLTSSGWVNYNNSDVLFFQTGEAVIKQIIDDLQKAKKYIFIQFFIIKQGVIWDKIIEILAQKVKEGVEVKVIYDDWGAFTLPFQYYKKLYKEYGIEAINFNPVVPRVNFQMNFRNHRKIVVIDGNIGYTGGFNIADEYANLVERFGYWLDTGIKVTGDAVYSMALSFISDWEFSVKEKLDLKKYKGDLKIDNNYDVTPYDDSPLIESTFTQDVLLRMIGQAKKKIYLSSPYLIIDPELSNALSLVARSGVEVNIVIPEIPDKKFVYMVSESYIPELSNNGVKIYKYKPGFIHSKVFMVDNKVASVGTSNLDYRSLFLHFENNVVFTNQEAILDIEKFFKNAISKSRLVDPSKKKKRNIFYRALQNILRGFSSLL